MDTVEIELKPPICLKLSGIRQFGDSLNSEN
jgi:hypothetical protein